MLLPFFGSGQAYKIEFDLPAFADSQAVFASYYFGNLYVKDSLKFDKHGQAILEGTERLNQGIYQIHFSSQTHYDLLIAEDQKFKFYWEANKNTPVISGAKETEKFQAYINYLAGQKQQMAELNKLAQSDEVKSQKLQLNELVRSYQQKQATANSENLYGAIIQAGIPQSLPSIGEIPEADRQNDSLRWVYEYNYRKNHYWDNFDLGDLRLWHTPFVRERLDSYFNQVLLQRPDSVLPEAIATIERYKSNPELFQNLCSYLLNNSLQSRIMGMENVFVALAERYYLSGQASWVSDKTLSTIKREYALRKNNLVGNKAPELLLEDASGEFHSLRQSITPYTIVAFWEPDCGHCKKEIPRLYEDIFLKSNPSKLSIYAVYTMDNKDDWEQFINDHELNGWYNLWDPNQLSDMKILYGIRTTPSLFLLDKDQKIIAKQLDIPALRQLLQQLDVIEANQ